MIRLLVDTSSDYLKEELENKNIECVPLTITINEQVYIEGVNLERDEFYHILTTENTFPKTSQPTPHAFLEIFEDVKAKNEEMICVLLSSTLSGTYQSASLAKQMVDYDKIHLIDSKTATACTRILVDHACRLRENNKTCDEIIEELESLKSRVKIYGVLDTLEYLYRGGRLNKTTAAIGEIAKVKPMITINKEGNISVVGKCIGKTRALNFALKQVENAQIDTSFPIFTLYSSGIENCEAFETKLIKNGNTITQRLQLGATLGTHIGPEAFAIAFVEK